MSFNTVIARIGGRLLMGAAASVMLVSSVHARDVGIVKPGMANETPKELADVGFDEQLGKKIDLDLKFKDESGQEVTLGKYFADGKPVLLSLAYYSCPSLCNLHLNGLVDAFKKIDAPLGTEFHSVIVSIEPKETPEVATAKKANYIESYGRPEGAKGWHFLTGSEEQIKAIAKQIGFKYRWDEGEQQWAHAAAATVITPAGVISRYLYGVVFDPKTLRLSAIEAGQGTVGTLVDRLILYCFHFDPKESKYTVAAFNVMRAGGAMTVVVLVGFLIPFWFRQRRDET